MSSGGVRRSNDPEEAAARIAQGHAFLKHVRTQEEYPDIATVDQFADMIRDVMTNPDATRTLVRGRSAFWQDKARTGVVIDPKHPDGGSAFRPPAGKSYFDELT